MKLSLLKCRETYFLSRKVFLCIKNSKKVHLCSTGGIIMFGALFLFDDDFIHIVAISFTALILTELLMVALTVRTWHWLMLFAELLSLVIYAVSVIILKNEFGKFAKSFLYDHSLLSITY